MNTDANAASFIPNNIKKKRGINMINVFHSIKAMKVAEKANESNEKIVETSCNLIFEKIEKAAKQGSFSFNGTEILPVEK